MKINAFIFEAPYEVFQIESDNKIHLAPELHKNTNDRLAEKLYISQLITKNFHYSALIFFYTVT